MKIIITGGSGLIGRCLSNQLIEMGFTVLNLNRYGSNKHISEKDLISKKNIFWSNPEILDGANVVVHLAGANVAKRWTTAYKKEILESRTRGTLALVEACGQCEFPPQHIISASGIGIYPEGTKHLHTEQSEFGNEFLANVCKAWEHALECPRTNRMNISILRTGLVLSNKSKIMLATQTQFLLGGMVGSIGSPTNVWSWIHINDLCDLYCALIENKLPPGVYNAVAPNPCSQGDFGLAFENHPQMTLPWFLPWIKLQWRFALLINGIWRKFKLRPVIPAMILRWLWGERAAIALTNQNVSAKKTMDHGFCYHYPTIEKAMQHLQANPTN